MTHHTNKAGQPVNQQMLAALRGVVDDIQGLIAESDGVAGLHRNGDVAPWHELEAGGRYERLSHLPAAIEALQCSEVGRKCSEQCAEHGALTDEATKQAAQPLPSGPVMHMPSGVAFDEVIAAANPGDLVALTPQSAVVAQQVLMAVPITDAQIKRHTINAGCCPAGSKVMLVSSILRLLARNERFLQPASAQPLSDAELGDLIVSIADSNGFDTKDPAGVDELCRAVARAIEARLAIAQPVAVPDGYVLVPVEPTHMMLDAAVIAGDEPGSDYYTIYSAMLSAAQKGGAA